MNFRNTEGAALAKESVDFSFGENWRKYLDELHGTQLELARASLRDAFAPWPLDGFRFLDLGCGSGIFSLSAHTEGAVVVSVDIDPSSVACAEYLSQGKWPCHRGSVLDPAFLESLGSFHRVYSWGVLHHTGSMWRAVENAVSLLAPGGIACIALYNRPNRPRLHVALKRTYNRLPNVMKPLMRLVYGLAWLAARTIAKRESPIRFVREYGERARGMSFWRDVEDWLGGLPYEYVLDGEVESFLEERGLVVERVAVGPPGANNEYLVRRPD